MREEALHLSRRTEMAFGVCGEGASGFVEGGVDADAGEEVEEFAFVARGAGNTAGGEERDVVSFGEVDAGGVCLFLAPLEMALEFDVEVFFSKSISEVDDGFGEEGGIVCSERFVEGAVEVAGEGDEAGCGFGEFVPTDAGKSFGASEMSASEESAKVTISVLGADQHRQDGSVFKGEFGPCDGTDSVFGAGAVQARDSVETVAIREGEGGQVAVCSVACEGIRRGGTTKKAERTAGMEFNVPHLQAGVFKGGGGGGNGQWAAS
jgi:hypothetical protein